LHRAVRLAAAAERTPGRLKVRVTVTNRTGHKLPTAYPSRRMWLHLVVTEAGGAKIFESGARPEGFEPHHRTITAPHRTQVYEAEYRDGRGRLTTSLLRAAGYLKDNRILPCGFASKLPGIEPAGVGGDPDFLPGSDSVNYEIDTQGRQGPFRVTVEARFESIKPNHVSALATLDHPDAGAFIRLRRNHAAPLTIGRTEIAVPDQPVSRPVRSASRR
jgi:hypothetical protein